MSESHGDDTNAPLHPLATVKSMLQVDIERVSTTRVPDRKQAVRWASNAGSPSGQRILSSLRAGNAVLSADLVAAAVAEWEAAGRPEPPRGPAQ